MITKHDTSWPRVAGWWLRAAMLNAVQVGIVFAAGVTWDRWFLAHRLWSAERQGTAGATLVEYLAITFNWPAGQLANSRRAF